MKLTPELKAFKYYYKNLDSYIEENGYIFCNSSVCENIIKEIAETFNSMPTEPLEIDV